jgi:hypothetical protein
MIELQVIISTYSLRIFLESEGEKKEKKKKKKKEKKKNSHSLNSVKQPFSDVP